MTNLDLRFIRRQMGLTQAAFAAELGYDRRMIIAYEAGTAPIPPVVRLAAKMLLIDHTTPEKAYGRQL